MLPRFASPDQHHPNDLGYSAMAKAIDHREPVSVDG